jgi:hypothetical protein
MIMFMRQRVARLLQPHQITATVTKIDYDSQKFTKNHKSDYNSLKAIVSH